MYSRSSRRCGKSEVFQYGRHRKLLHLDQLGTLQAPPVDYYAWDYTHECILQLWHVRTQKDVIELGSQRIQEGHWKVSQKMQWEPGSCSTNILDWHEFCSRLLDCWRKGSNLFISHAHVKLLKCTASICVWFGKKGSEIDMRHFNHSCKTDNIQEKERESERETYHP